MVAHVFDDAVHPAAPPREFAVGYDAGRARCLAIGREATQADALRRQADHSPAYWEGWSWAAWDYEDANGLPHTARS